MYPQKAKHWQRDSHPLYHSCVRTVAALGRTDVLPRIGRLINQNLNSGNFKSLISSNFFSRLYLGICGKKEPFSYTRICGVNKIFKSCILQLHSTWISISVSTQTELSYFKLQTQKISNFKCLTCNTNRNAAGKLSVDHTAFIRFVQSFEKVKCYGLIQSAFNMGGKNEREGRGRDLGTAIQ